MSARPLPRGVEPTRHATLANRLNSAAIHLLRRLAQTDARTGLTPARLSALSVLAYGGAQTMGELARSEGVTLPTASRLVEALVAAGLIVRAPDRSDRRIVRIAITPRGRRLMEQGRSRRIAALARELEALDADELDALTAAVTALERLERPAARAAHEKRAATPREPGGRRDRTHTRN
jgi:DNA-binding MarR family transcriptional regulator